MAGKDLFAKPAGRDLLAPTVSTGNRLLRGLNAVGEGVSDSVYGLASALPELSASVSRAVGLPAPEKGYYDKGLKDAAVSAGRVATKPLSEAVGDIGEYNATDRGLRAAGKGAGDAASLLLPAAALAKAAKSGSTLSRISNAVRAQPTMQVAAGGVGGGVAQGTDNTWLGLAAALGTGVGGTVALNKIAKRGATNLGERKIIDMLKRLGGGDVDEGIALARQKMASEGTDTALVDVTGLRGEKLARAAGATPGPKAAQTVDDFVNARGVNRGPRLQGAADELAPNNMYEYVDDLKLAQQKSAAPLYDEAFAPRSDKAGKIFAPWDERLQQFLDDPVVREGMKKGIRTQQLDSLAKGVPFNPKEYAVKGFDEAGELIIGETPNLRAMDAAKRGIDEIIGAARDDFGNIKWTPNLRAVDQVRSALVKKLDDITTDSETGRSAYKEARAAWAGPAALEDAAWAGRKFLRGDEEVTAKAIAAMSESDKSAFRMGARREVSKMINTDTQAAVNKFADKKSELWTKLRLVFPDDASFNKFRGDIQIELKKAKTEKFISVRGRSPTADIQQDVAELGRQLPNWVEGGLNVAGSLATFNFGRAASILSRPALDYIKRPSAKTAETLAEALLETSPKAQETMLSALAKKAASAPDLDMRMVAALMGKITSAQGAGSMEQELGDL